jgi:hypothetical protein
MKPIFGIDITNDKLNERMHAEDFIAASANDETSRQLDESSNRAESTIKSAKLPTTVTVLQFVFLIVGGISILSFLNSISDVGFAAAYAASPLTFYVGIAGIAIFVAISVLATGKMKKVLESEDAKDVVNEIESLTEKIYKELDVPKNSFDVDVLLFNYVEHENGTITPKTSPLGLTPYINFELKAFKRNGKLCLADLTSRYDFELEKLSGITRVDKKISVPQWNKAEPHNSDKFKKFHLVKNNMDCIFFKPYYILEFINNDELYGIYFPCYELEAFERLTGLRYVAGEEE